MWSANPLSTGEGHPSQPVLGFCFAGAVVLYYFNLCISSFQRFCNDIGFTSDKETVMKGSSSIIHIIHIFARLQSHTFFNKVIETPMPLGVASRAQR